MLRSGTLVDCSHRRCGFEIDASRNATLTGTPAMQRQWCLMHACECRGTSKVRSYHKMAANTCRHMATFQGDIAGTQNEGSYCGARTGPGTTDSGSVSAGKLDGEHASQAVPPCPGDEAQARPCREAMTLRLECGPGDGAPGLHRQLRGVRVRHSRRGLPRIGVARCFCRTILYLYSTTGWGATTMM